MLLVYVIVGLSLLGTIIYLSYLNYIKKLCTPSENSNRIIISNLECVSIIYELINKNNDLENIIITCFMKTFAKTVDPTKENFDKYMLNLMNILGYSYPSYYNIIRIHIQLYIKLNYKTINNNCNLYLLLGNYRYSLDFLKELTNLMKDKIINDTNDQFLLEDLINIYLYYRLINCSLNKNIFSTTLTGKVLFQNSVIYKMFTCFNDL